MVNSAVPRFQGVRKLKQEACHPELQLVSRAKRAGEGSPVWLSHFGSNSGETLRSSFDCATLRSGWSSHRHGTCTERTPVLADGARGYGVSLR